jgi:hypothetical protein
MVLYQLKPYFNKATYKLLEKIKPVVWNQAKTEGIDFTKPFLWFDDDLFIEERESLIKHGVLDNYIKVDLLKNEHQLDDFMRSFPLPINQLPSISS